MRLFVIEWANGLPEMVDVIKEIKEKGHEIIYWSGSDLDKINGQYFSETIFHDHSDAIAGRPARGIDDSDFLPPGRELTIQLAETESTILTMMNKKYPALTVDERKHLYYHMVRYWTGVLTSMRPDVVIFLCTPHTVYNYVVYSLAKLFGIKTIMFDVALVGDYRIIGLNDYIKGNSYLEKLVSEGQNYSLSDLSEVTKSYYANQINPDIDAIPAYTKDYVASRSGFALLSLRLKVLLKSIINLSIFKKLLIFLATEIGANMKKEYVALQTKPDWQRPYIYLPLNYQPEATTSPMGGIYVDQILMVETLAASIPSDWLIYVKEHPGQWLTSSKRYFNYRYRGYYKEIMVSPNVRLVPIDTNNYDLINHSRAVATVTGTPGWEALLRAKPAIVFGFPWYQHCPGVMKVNDVVSCRKAVEKIKSGLEVHSQGIINFLYNLEKVSWLGFNDIGTKKASRASENETRNAYVKFLLSQIESV